MICPCQMQQANGKAYRDCCQPLHDGQNAANPEALMRSRFSAFVLGLGEYLTHSWARETCPDDLDSSADASWLKLQIVAAKGQTVQFKAFFTNVDFPQHPKIGVSVLEECSQFIQQDGRWVYHSGEPVISVVKQQRNDDCLCGSGKKFKKCCGQN